MPPFVNSPGSNLPSCSIALANKYTEPATLTTNKALDFASLTLLMIKVTANKAPNTGIRPNKPLT